MKKEYRFDANQGQYVNWNSLIPMMLDIWFAVKATRDLNTGEVVVKVSEEHKAQVADPMQHSDVLKLVVQLAAVQVKLDKLTKRHDSILSSIKLATIYLTEGKGSALNVLKSILGEE